MAGLTARWKSIATSTRAPTASLTAATRETTSSTTAGASM